ncbi:MAG: RlpA-like double-psi beta-barrel-protein domain-containing protein-containing protein [Linnemannia elongata]|nr:MAG: RlpA-like double-psi beta-barrel-protein domain-containing protein-containing protein [Linnemannia elongata]
MTVMYKFVLFASVALAVAAAPVRTSTRHSTAVDLSIASQAQASTFSSNFVARADKGDSTDNNSGSPAPKKAGSNDTVSAAASGGEFSGRGTWFTDTTGSCDVPFNTNDMIVAMNEAQMGGSSQCGKSVKISYGGKTATAKVVDTCPSQFCSKGALDLSQAVFKKLAPLDVGVINIKWEFA